jgi:acyl dehydratase
VNFNDEPVYVGRDFGGRGLTIDTALVAQYRDAIEDRSPLYAEYAPALILHSECYRDLNWYLKNIFGNLHARQEWELFHAIPIGTAVATRGFIRERYRKRGRDYVVKETWTLDEDGRLLHRGITHQSFLVEGDSREMVVTKDRERSSERRFEVGAGDGPRLEPVVKTVTEDMCMRFSGPGDNYHTNREAALALGFPDIVVQGMLPICVLSELMTREFGMGWLAGGKMDVRLVNVLWGGETISATAQIRERVPEADRERIHLDVWAEKRDGAKVIVGSASALA